MTIKTKFNIGDEVWIYIDEVIKAEITAITVYEDCLIYQILTIDRCEGNFHTALKEHELFRTKQELLDSL